jgi:hypothetical protein
MCALSAVKPNLRNWKAESENQKSCIYHLPNQIYYTCLFFPLWELWKLEIEMMHMTCLDGTDMVDFLDVDYMGVETEIAF